MRLLILISLLISSSLFRYFSLVQTFDMLHDGDRVLVCLSGGKDSLSLLHTLRQYQFVAKSRGITFELGALTVRALRAVVASLCVEMKLICEFTQKFSLF